MALLKQLFWAVLIASAVESYGAILENFTFDDNFSIILDEIDEGLNLIIKRDGKLETIGVVGQTKKGFSNPRKYEDRIYLTYNGGDVSFTPKKIPDGYTVDVTWSSLAIERYQDCFDLGDNQWFGGPQQKEQYWPIQKLNLSEYSYVTKEADNAAVAEPYWLNSRGFFLYALRTTPLFVDQHNIKKNHVCFIAEIKPPYSSQRPATRLSYAFGFTLNAPLTHMYMVYAHFSKPIATPDYLMAEKPIWSTWAKYKRDINESTVLEFAQEIINNGFENSQLEIDDLWETCYGSFNVDTKKFPDLKNLTGTLRTMGFRTTIWIHPFINKDCEPWYSEALQKGYLVENEDGKVDTPWWNSVGPTAAYVDFTNKNASDWWYDRLKNLKEKYDIDSYKFDAGETSWSPQVPVQTGNSFLHPSHIATKYLETCARFGPIVEVRTGQSTQKLPIYVRMIDHSKTVFRL